MSISAETTSEKYKDYIPTVCFIGSMRFWDDMLIEAEKFHREGKLVILPIKDSRLEIPQESIELYDRLIREAIRLSDYTHVINKNGYIGKSVKSEIMYALANGKVVSYMEEPLKIATLCGSFKFTQVFNMITELFTKNRIITLIPSFLNIDNVAMLSITDDQVKNLHDIHYAKIDMSDVVIVVDTGFSPNDIYIGEDTAREIKYAKAKNKRILYLSKFSSIEQLTTEVKELQLLNRYKD